MKPKKRIWELQSSTICKVVGMALYLKDLRRIARKFGIAKDDPLMDEEFMLHTTVVQLCTKENLISKHTEKTLERRFVPYAKKVALDDPLRLINCVRTEPEAVEAPLWAVLWGLATRSSLAEAKIESSLFGYIHMLEHRLVRDHWNSVREICEEEETAAEKDDEITRLKRALLDMQWANSRLERLVESLQARADDSDRHREKSCPNSPRATGASCAQCGVLAKVRDLKALLDQAKHCNYELEAENATLRAEIECLILEGEDANEAEPAPEPIAGDSSAGQAQGLKGKRIALVGGIESLESLYRQIVESLGGRFCRHDGNCCNGAKPLEDSIIGADLVVCPIEVNSHNAVKTVKKACKDCGIPCCFPRTGSLTGLRKAVEDLYCDDEVA